MKKLLLLCIPIIMISPFLLTGCGDGSDTQAAKDGDTVSVHYTGTFEDGTQFDSSYGKSPLTFVIGSGQMIAGFDNAVRGMTVGEIKTITIPPEEAYGEYRPELVVVIDLDEFPEGTKPAIGQQVPIQNNAGQQFMARIVKIGTSSVTVDANHELAGKSLIFEIELVSITPGGQ